MIRNLSQIDLLVESGLCPIKQLPYARIVLSDVEQGITSMVYRELAIKIFSKITNFILEDSILYQRLRQILMTEQVQYEKMDAETLKKFLDEFELEASDREEGTDSLRKSFQADTPGEPGYKKTLNTIRRVMKK